MSKESKFCPRCGGAIPAGEGRCPKCMLQAGLGEESSLAGADPAFEGDRNLLFGVFAVQLRKVTPQEVMAAAGAWAADASKGLPARLKEQGVLSQTDAEFIARLVDEAVRAHSGDIEATLNTLGGGQVLQATFGDSIDLSRHRYGAAGSPVYLDGTIDPDSVPGVQETPGRYTHVSEHARGGMGRVLLVHDGFLGRNVALKELMPGQKPTSDPDNPSTPVRQYMGFLSRFLQEARITGQLEHPSIVPVYELGHRQDGTLYYTMKLVRGKTLREAVNRSKTMRERLGLLAHFVDLCQAVAYAHSRGIVHRDIKPDNVMVGEFGETVVLDWGLAKSKDREDCHADGLAETIRMLQLGDVDSALKTQYGQVMGTPGYMSPEQALGRITEVDERSDVYSLGAVLYQMLSGRPPFTGMSAKEILQKVVDDEPEALDPDAVPPELAAICRKAMAKRADDRYPSASAMADEVRRFQTGAIVQAYSYGFAHHLKRFAKRHKAVLTASAAALVAIVALAGYSYVNIRQAKDVAEERLYEASVAYAYVAVENDQLLDAHEAVLSAPPEYRNWEWGLLAAISHPTLFKLDADIKSANSIGLSPDYTLYATGGRSGQVKIWNSNDGSLYRAFQLGNTGITSLSFSTDAELLLGSNDAGEISLWNIVHDSQLLYEKCEASVQQAVLAPSAGTVVVACTNGKCYVFVVATGECLLTLDGTQLADTMPIAISPDGQYLAAGYQNGLLRIWDVRSGLKTMEIEAYRESPPYMVAFDKEGNRVITSGNNDVVRIWDRKSGEVVREFTGQWAGTFAPDGEHMVSIATQGSSNVITWNLADGQSIRNLARVLPLNRVWMDFNSMRLITRNPDGNALVFSANPQLDQIELSCGTARVTTATFSPDSHLVITGAGGRGARWDDHRAIIWDVATGRKVNTLDAQCGPVNSTVFLRDSNQVLTGHCGNKIIRWDINSGKLLQIFETDQWVKQIVLSSDKRTMVSAGWGSIKGAPSTQVWDVETGRRLTKIDNARADCAVYDPLDRFFAIGTPQSQVIVWDAHTYKELLRIEPNEIAGSPVTSLAVSPDGQLLAIDSDKVTIWDTGTWKRIAALDGSGEAVCFSPDGSRLVSGDQIWDTTSWRKLITLVRKDGTGLGRAATFSPDGKVLVTGGGSSYLLWRAFPWRTEDYPGSPDVAVFDRMSLERQSRESEVRRRNLEIDGVETCWTQLNALDNALMAWANEKHKAYGEPPPPLSELEDYAAAANVSFLPCPSGGEYVVSTVGGYCECLVHGRQAVDFDQLMRDLETVSDTDNRNAKSILSAQIVAALPADAVLLNSRGWEWVTVEPRHITAAIPVLTKAVSLAPDKAHIIDSLAYAEFAAGNLDEAVIRFREAMDKGSQVSTCGLALALAKRGTDADVAESCQILKRVLSAKQKDPGAPKYLELYVSQTLDTLRAISPPREPSVMAQVNDVLELAKPKTGAEGQS